jgi:hypothetical protein
MKKKATADKYLAKIATINRKTLQFLADLGCQINITPKDQTLTEDNLIDNTIGLREALAEVEKGINTYGLDLLTRISSLQSIYSSLDETKRILQEEAKAKGKSLYHQISDPDDTSPRSIADDISHLYTVLKHLNNHGFTDALKKTYYSNAIIQSLIELGVEPALLLSCPHTIYYINHTQISQLLASMTERSWEILLSRPDMPTKIINAILTENYDQITSMISPSAESRLDTLRMIIDLGIIFDNHRIVSQALEQYIIHYKLHANPGTYQALVENAATAFIRGNLEICSLFTTLETWSLFNLYEQDQFLSTIIYRSGTTVSQQLIKTLYDNGFINAQFYIAIVNSSGSNVESESDFKRELIVKAFELISNEIMLELLQETKNDTIICANMIGLSLLFKQLTEEKQTDFIHKNDANLKLLIDKIDISKANYYPGLAPLTSLIYTVEKARQAKEKAAEERMKLIADRLIQEELEEKLIKEEAVRNKKEKEARRKKQSKDAKTAHLAKKQQAKEDEISKKKAKEELLLKKLATIQLTEQEVTEEDSTGWSTATKAKVPTTYKAKGGISYNSHAKPKKVEPPKVDSLSALEGTPTVPSPVDISRIGNPQKQGKKKAADLLPPASVKHDPTAAKGTIEETSGDDDDNAPHGGGNAAIIPKKSAEIPTIAILDSREATSSTEALKLQLEIEKLKLAQIAEQRRLEELKQQEPAKAADVTDQEVAQDLNGGTAYAQQPQQQYYNDGYGYAYAQQSHYSPQPYYNGNGAAYAQQQPPQDYSDGLPYDQSMGLYYDQSINMHYDQSINMHYDRNKGLHYDSSQGLYYNANTGEYYHPSLFTQTQQQAQVATTHSSRDSNQGSKGAQKGTTSTKGGKKHSDGASKGDQYADSSSQQKIGTSDFKNSDPKELKITFKTSVSQKAPETEEHREYREAMEAINKSLEEAQYVPMQNNSSREAPEKLSDSQEWVTLPFHILDESLFIGQASGANPFEDGINNQGMKSF